MPDPSHIAAPFRGLRYNPAAARDLSALISPPYDIISPAEQAALYAQHEHNFVRLELAQATEADTDSDNRYTRAAETLQAWRREGVLVRDETPSLYVVESEFTVAGQVWKRRGVFAAVRLPEPGEQYVLAHEDTFKEAKADRYRLMLATHCMISPVLSLHEDQPGELAQALYRLDREPDAVATDHEGVTHRLWVVQEEALLSALTGAIGAGPLYIADGHHRFETARAYRDEMRRLHPDAPPDAAFNYALMLIVSAQDPALKILPTHRVVSGLGVEGLSWVRSRIGEFFAVQPRPLPVFLRIAEELEQADGDRHVYAAYATDGSFDLLRARSELLPPTDTLVGELDVTVLHELLLAPMAERDPAALGPAEAETAGQGPTISYVVDPEEAAARVRTGAADLAFFLRAPRVEQIMAVARAGERMPKKSTYFYPKALAGLVISDASVESR